MTRPTASERLAEIRANDYLRDRHGVAAIRQSDLAAVDVPRLVAAVEAALRCHEPMEAGMGQQACPKCSQAAGLVVFAPCAEVRSITAALAKEPIKAECTPPEGTTPTTAAMPHADEWKIARDAFDAVTNGVVAVPIEGGDGERLPVGVYHLAPEAARRAVDALGNLLAVYDGYGEPPS